MITTLHQNLKFDNKHVPQSKNNPFNQNPRPNKPVRAPRAAASGGCHLNSDHHQKLYKLYQNFLLIKPNNLINYHKVSIKANNREFNKQNLKFEEISQIYKNFIRSILSPGFDSVQALWRDC